MASSSSFSSSVTTAIIPFPSSSSHKKNPPSSFPLRPHSPLTLSSSSSSYPPPSFDLRLYWTDLIAQIDSSLSAAIPVRYPENIHESMRYSVMSPGAKRAPPIMCVATACHLLGAPRAAAFPTACALEMVHAASLVHDDLPCMDAAPLRRGRPTNHALFGEEMAILAGDALFPLGFSHIISETPKDLVPEETLLRVVAVIARTVGSRGMAAGQLLDLKGGNGGEVDVMLVLEKKFGDLAECSAVCGGLLGGAEEEVLESLRRYGRAVGVLYQVVDDILMEDNGVGGKVRSKNSSVVAAYGMERATEIAEEFREKAKVELSGLSEIYGMEMVMPLYSFVEYAVERGYVVEGGRGEEAASVTFAK